MMKLSTLVAIFAIAIACPPYVLSSHNTPEALESRVSAVGKLNVSESASTSSSENTGPVDGETVYTTNCNACHGSGIAGAPILGDADEWEDRIGQGIDALISNALGGFTGSFGVMPAKGGNPGLSDDAVQAAVEYMVDQSQ